MSIQSGCCCCVNSDCSVLNSADNNRRSPRNTGVIRPLAFLVVTALLAMTVSHVCDKFSADSSFRVIKSDLTTLRNHLGTLSIEVKHVMKMRDKLESQLAEINEIILKVSQAIHQLDVGDIRIDQHNIKNVRDVVKNELRTYDADKTGRTDYALKASGGAIISIRDTRPYEAGSTSSLTVFGISICHPQNTPQSIIQTSVLPGQCWAFEGISGCVVIKLLGRVFVSSVSIEHITKDMSPTGETSAAPRDFSVWGLDHVDDPNGFLFGEFTYNNDGTPVQEFPVQNLSEESYEIVEVKFHTNSGNPVYTCVYRIRVHGTLDQ
ncbi:hypothetical protein PV326_007003 [Microctonus aethiopoides]|uniref:SUN domain-containing protein n=1 Tax=Microctonus aethiopoides TaxID=144406 RepID=A0AA39FIQ6_9HYME|nr:hypothetical protein PV326_007003 [Microctonus aethiopoides]KAK0170089.1 hypothetical protein PV328_010694 [Microctonus aethiopoides]